MIALKDFPFSRDGIKTELAKKGDPVIVPDDLKEGLVAEGLIGLSPAEAPAAVAPPAWNVPPVSAPENKVQPVPAIKTPAAKPKGK